MRLSVRLLGDWEKGVSDIVSTFVKQATILILGGNMYVCVCVGVVSQSHLYQCIRTAPPPPPTPALCGSDPISIFVPVRIALGCSAKHRGAEIRGIDEEILRERGPP